MRILSVHNRYQNRGGEEESREAEERLLRQMNHLVEVYEEDNERIKDLNSLSVAIKTVWSTETYRAIRLHLEKQNCDVVHVQNFFPLISPSVYYAAKAEGVPVVQTLRNYRLLCPNASFFRDGHPCEDCLGKLVPWPSVVHACYPRPQRGWGSRSLTGVVAAMLTTHRVMRTWIKAVDVYVALSEFSRQKFIEGGFPAEKIVVKPNFVEPDPGLGEGQGGYALFVGRLSFEKGVDTMLAAWEQLGPQLPLKIVGDGPLAGHVAEVTQKLPYVELLGRKPLAEVYDLIGAAKLLIFPSEWYETFGRVAVEAFAKGTPVIAADIGAIAEIVDHGRTGLRFRPGDPEDLAAKVEWAQAHANEIRQMRHEARAEFEAKYTAKDNYRQLMEIYALARGKLLPPQP